MLNYLNAKPGCVKDAFGLFSHSFLQAHPLDFYIKDNGFLVASANIKIEGDVNWKYITFTFPGNDTVEITAPDMDNIAFTGIYQIDGTNICRDSISKKINLIHGINFNFKEEGE